MVEAYTFLAGRRIKRETAESIIAQATASRSKPTDVRKKVKELTKD